MRPRSARRLLLRSAVLTGLLALVLAHLLWLRPDPPSEAFGAARKALSRARKAEAARYAPDEMGRAEASWRDALAAWQLANKRWFATRDYTVAQRYAAEAARQGETAATRSIIARDSLRTVAVQSLPGLHDEITRLKQQLDALPFDRARHTALATARSLLAEAERALARHDYKTAAATVHRTAAYADSVHADVTTLLDHYLADLPAWQAWHDETIAWSRSHGAPAIVVDKLSRRCLVYVDGALHATYPVEFGLRWLGDKRHEGDLTTPEGRYRITRKHGPGETIFHRALVINYPNAEDRRRFAAAKRSGALPPDARIGGLIELHGHGGRGADWTRGCVALRNDDIDALFRLVPLETPVTIVGALDAPVPADRPPLTAPAPMGPTTHYP